MTLMPRILCIWLDQFKHLESAKLTLFQDENSKDVCTSVYSQRRNEHKRCYHSIILDYFVHIVLQLSQLASDFTVCLLWNDSTSFQGGHM